MRKLFGTDGIRGVANEYPITPEMAVKLGRVVANLLGTGKHPPEIVVGRDTRISGPMIEYALISGICSAGANAHTTGVLPTPGVAFMTAAGNACAGIVVSASHNPYYDNGIKVFNEHGFKLSDKTEADIETMLLDEESTASAGGSIPETGSVFTVVDPLGQYKAFLKRTLPQNLSLDGLRVVLDCSNGATSSVAPELLTDLGVDVISIFTEPNGKNINENCGSEHPERLQEMVITHGADMGLAFDGDGDRLVAVDEKGNTVTGDAILTVCADFMHNKDWLKNDCVVSTIMSNMGLTDALNKMGIRHEVSKVGDRYVMEQMIAHGAVLGGEDSGHMILLDHHTTGDGLLTALKLMEILAETSKPLSVLAGVMKTYPQVLLAVDVTRKPELDSIPEIRETIHAVEAKLGKKGRVVVRYSGTQPVCRVMVEGSEKEEVEAHCRRIAEVVSRKLG